MKPDYSESKYKQVPLSTTDTDGGIEVPNGALVGVQWFTANGASPDAYVILAFDWGGANEKIFGSTRGDIDGAVDPHDPVNQFTGITGKKIKLILVNDAGVQSPMIGGKYQLVKVV